MKASLKNRLEGAIHEVKGTLRETVGEVKNDPDLAADGRVEKLAGTVQKKVGQIQTVFEK
jgi:uncharacterized protein YjbJ (UPF0337 family)